LVASSLLIVLVVQHSALGYVTPKDRLEGRHLEIYKARDQKLEAAREQRRQRREQLEVRL